MSEGGDRRTCRPDNGEPATCRSIGDRRVKFGWLFQAAQLVNDRWQPQLPSHTCKRPKLFSVGGRRQQKNEDQIHALTIDCVKVDWVLEPCEDTKRLCQGCKSRMWNRDAVAHAGGPKLFALIQLRGDEFRWHLQRGSGHLGQVSQEL